LGSATFGFDRGGRILTAPSASGNPLRVEYVTAPSAPYTLTAYLDWAAPNANYVTTFLVFRSSGGAYVYFGPGFDSGSGGWSLDVAKWTNETTFSAHYTQVSLATIGGMPNWYRIADDNSNRICSYSFNGLDFVPFHTVGRTDFLTANAVGWGGMNSSGSSATSRLRSWSVV
jgi:hypothetical protein